MIDGSFITTWYLGLLTDGMLATFGVLLVIKTKQGGGGRTSKYISKTRHRGKLNTRYQAHRRTASRTVD
jgi:hypothetical protein